VLGVYPKNRDSVKSEKLYVTVQTLRTARPKVAGNTIPTAREEQGVVHVRGESRPALFPTSDLQPNINDPNPEKWKV
jgi:hypothetical protein